MLCLYRYKIAYYLSLTGKDNFFSIIITKSVNT